ncbi:hypothetical protein SO802_025971 [Lithocarpus litseifolius]|uniref:Uncharacterized protein n=1 Tax=Lithocarpus litseifolius TaxID=425828 RepID=A0AAW2C023_9ROSI
MHITSQYLVNEEKAVVASSKAEALDVEVLYFKGFELLRRYLVKHGPEIDLEDLDFEAIDKEIEADEAAQALAVAVIGEDPPEPKKDGNDASAA